MRVQYLRPSYICLKNRDDSKLTKAEKGTILDDILSEGLALKKEKDKKEEMTIAKMEIPEEQVHFIVSIFGPQPMVSGDISFISCLTQKVEIVTDSKKGLCRLIVADWKDFEALNLKYMSQNIFLE